MIKGISDMKIKKIISLLLAVSIASAVSYYPQIAEAAETSADLNPLVVKTLVDDNNYMVDDDRNGVITEEELAKARTVTVKLDGITDISWMSKLKNCKILSLYGGDLTDFSVMKDMPVLERVIMHGVPIEDLAFMDGLSLDTVMLYDMDQISFEQRLEKVNIHDITVNKGFSERVLSSPLSILGEADLHLKLDDEDGKIAVCSSGYYKTSGYLGEITGISAGQTVFHIYNGENEIASGTVTVVDDGAFEPVLHDTVPAAEFPQRLHKSGKVILQDGKLYELKGDSIDLIDDNVKQFIGFYTQDYMRNRYTMDAVLKNDGTLYLNDAQVPDIKFKEIRHDDSGSPLFAATDKGILYGVCAKSNGYELVEMTDDFSWFTDTNNVYVNKEGEAVGYSIKYNSDNKPYGVLEKTGIMNPVQTGRLSVLDDQGVLWHVNKYQSREIFVKRVAENVKYGGYYYKEFDKQYGYETEDGIIHLLTKPEEILEGYSSDPPKTYSRGYIDSDVIQLKLYFSDDDETSDYILSWKILNDRTLCFAFRKKELRIANVNNVIGLSSSGDMHYLYIMMTDGSIWNYCIETEKCTEVLASTGKPESDTPEDPETPVSVKGDADSSGKTDSADLLYILNALMSDDSDISASCDMNDDGKINITDICMLKSLILGE